MSDSTDRRGRFLKITDVVSATSLSRATIYRLIRKGLFPSPIKVSTQRVAWAEAKVDAWMNEQAGYPLN